MTIQTIFGHCLLFVGLVLMAISRPSAGKRSRTRSRAAVESERIADSGTLAGVPRRVLMSERSSPGALLRETLITRPFSDERN
jgi:hypothetical protein